MSLKALLYRSSACCALATALMVVPPASADTLETDGWLNGHQNFTLHRPAHTQAAAVGGFTGVWDGFDIVFWCFDLDHVFAPGTTYQNYFAEAVPTPPGNDRVARLFDEAFDEADDSTNNSVAFQLALWNILYDTDTTVLLGPGFYADHGPVGSTALSTANTWLAGLDDPALKPSNWQITYLHSKPVPGVDRTIHQSFVFGTRVLHDVPEPPMLPLILTAAGLAMLLQWRRSAQERGR